MNSGPVDPSLLDPVIRAKEIIGLAGGEGVELRLVGSIAVYVMCEARGRKARLYDRALVDLDFVGRKDDLPQIVSILESLGYKADHGVLVATEGERLVFSSDDSPWGVDVFLDRLRFCHTVELGQRFDFGQWTIPLADLLLTKLQYIAPRDRDIAQANMLLQAYEFGDSDNGVINIGRICDVLSRSWGFYHTSTLNLQRMREHVMAGNPRQGLFPAKTIDKIRFLESELSKAPKTIPWKLRALVGERIKWYRDVQTSEVF